MTVFVLFFVVAAVRPALGMGWREAVAWFIVALFLTGLVESAVEGWREGGDAIRRYMDRKGLS